MQKWHLQLYKKAMIENTSNIYSIVNELKYDLYDADGKQLYKQFVSWCCNGSSITPLKHTNDPILEEVPTEKDYFSSIDERIYIDMRDNEGYTDELKKLRCNDSDLVVKINLKKSFPIKCD